ncbi:MAG: polysaccharide biosynthesis tyrosine autokinase [Phycisphaerales bacterium]|nr:polysaccharide biosynthesis tyrosine autokinase [Phycisphaerales bacterium]
MAEQPQAAGVLPGSAGMAALPGPVSVAVGEPTSGITGRDVLRILKQRRLMIVLLFVVLYGLAVGATFAIARFAPAYTSDAGIRLVPPGRQGSIRDEQLPRDYVQAQLATIAADLRSPVLLQQVLTMPEIRETEFFKWYGEEKFDEALLGLQKALSAAPLRDTMLVRVAVTVSSPREARDIANTIVREYVSRRQSEEGVSGQGRLQALRAQEVALETQLRSLRQRQAEVRDRQDMPALESQSTTTTQTIAVLNNTMAELRARRADVEAQLEYYRSVTPRNLMSAEVRLFIEADPTLRYYRQQVEALDIQIEVLRQHSIGEEHRDMLRLKTQRDEFFSKETARRQELVDDYQTRQVESMETELARVQNMFLSLTDQLAEAESTLRELDAAIREFDNLKNEEQRLSNQLEAVQRQVTDASSTLEADRSRGLLESVLAPRAPLRPSRPNYLVFLGGGFVLALLISVGLAFLRELTDQSIRTPVDIARYGHISVLGSVPLLDDDESDTVVDAIEQATRKAPQSLVAESFRQIRAHLVFSGPLDSQRVLLITSARPEEGKTAVAANLAVTFAQGNQRVLLIDCNFRRPGLRNAFENMRGDGLSNILVGRNTPAEVISRTSLANLDVLSPGPMPPNPAELLGSAAMRELLANAKKTYDRILLDGPPCLLISDALLLAAQADAVIIVARAGGGSRGALRRARDQFQRIGARVIGGVLNGVRARPGGYFRQQYREFYDYTSDEVVPQALPGEKREIEGGKPE